MHQTAEEISEGTRRKKTVRHNFPDRPLPKSKDGVFIPDSPNPHTQLGREDGRNGPYDQAREFDGNGLPVGDIDFTDHGRPHHPNPHQHPRRENPTGGTRSRGEGIPLI
jgi:hypothetical protein